MEQDKENLRRSYILFGQLLNEYNNEINQQEKEKIVDCLCSVIQGIQELEESIRQNGY